MLGRNSVGISFFFCKHEDRRFGKLKLVDKQVTHAFRVIDATLELVVGVPVRYTDDHSLLPPVGVGWGARRSARVRRRSIPISGRRHRGRRLCRNSTRIGYVSDGMTEGTSNGSGSRWQLQRRTAVGTVNEHRGIHDGGAGGGGIGKLRRRKEAELKYYKSYFVT